MIWIILIALATPLLFIIFYKRDVVANYAPPPPQPLPPLAEQPKAEVPAAAFNFNDVLTASRFENKPTDRPNA